MFDCLGLRPIDAIQYHPNTIQVTPDHVAVLLKQAYQTPAFYWSLDSKVMKARVSCGTLYLSHNETVARCQTLCELFSRCWPQTMVITNLRLKTAQDGSEPVQEVLSTEHGVDGATLANKLLAVLKEGQGEEGQEVTL